MRTPTFFVSAAVAAVTLAACSSSTAGPTAPGDPTPSVAPVAIPITSSRESQPGDDRGRGGRAQSGDDRGGQSGTPAADDHGRNRTGGDDGAGHH